MSESMIGKVLYVCDCGPECKCDHSSEEPSSCACGEPAVRRKVLVEDDQRIYVAETGHADAVDEPGTEAFTTSDGRPVQGFTKPR